MSNRRVTNPVYVGGVKVGGGADVTVQSMTKTDTRDIATPEEQINITSTLIEELEDLLPHQTLEFGYPSLKNSR